MNTVTFKQTSALWPEPGYYRTGSMNGIRTCTVACPDCGGFFSLSAHQIRPNGDVRPSLVCPDKECGFHVMAVLENWDKEDNE